MYYLLSFKQKQESTKNDMEGFDVKSVRIFTSSFNKRQELIDIYKNKGFSLISLVEEDQEIPNGYEGKSIVDEYWFPNLVEFKNKYLSYEDLADSFLKEKPPQPSLEKPKLAIPAGPSTSKMKSGQKVCIHKFNCEAHRDICVQIHGLPEIYMVPVL